MNVDLEERLRADLPRLADALAMQPAVVGYDVRPDREASRRRIGLVAAAAVVVVALAVGVVALVRDGDQPRRVHTPPAQRAAGTWDALPDSGLTPVENVAAVWTGSEVIVWGGNAGIMFSQYGAAYDPASDSWRSITPNQWAGPGTMSTWTGERLVVVAKRGGAAYDPTSDSWTELPLLPDGVNSGFAGVVWSGTDIYGAVWGAGELRVARYDETGGRWVLGAAQAATADVPAATGSGWAIPSVATWFDGEVYVWAGDRGWAYDPARDSWRTLPSLPDGVAGASVLAVADGALYAVLVDADAGTLSVHRLDGAAWASVVRTAASGVVHPTVTAAGADLYVVDATGSGAAVVIDAETATVSELDGSPLLSTGGVAATWAGDGLFVWGGLTGGAPDSAWYRPAE